MTSAAVSPMANSFQRITPNPLSPVQQFGTAGRNIAQGPGYADWDFSAFKNIPAVEGKEFQFRAVFFNFLNHTNFRLPDSDISSPTFNQILAAQPPRLIQLALEVPVLRDVSGMLAWLAGRAPPAVQRAKRAQLSRVDLNRKFLSAQRLFPLK